jgi:hypothetical protein
LLCSASKQTASPDAGEGFGVFVRGFDGKSHAVHFLSDVATVQDLKEKVFERTKIPVRLPSIP